MRRRQSRHAASDLAGLSDLDVETMNVFPGDGGNIVIGLTTATGTANVLLSPRQAGEVADALRWLLDEV